MVFIIAGQSHAGKTLLAQKLLEKYSFPYLSEDHLKMGLIRAGYTKLTPLSSAAELTSYLWPVVKEMIKTAIENGQNLVVEGCYIPYDIPSEFGDDYLPHIRSIRLIMSENYIRSHFDEIKAHASVIENRLDDSDCTLDFLLRESREELEGCSRTGAEYHLYDTCFDIGEALEKLINQPVK